MHLSPELTRAYNDQIQLEFESSFTYLQMGADFELRSLPGMANWMRMQSSEEHGHAMKFIQFVLDRGGNLELKAIAAPAATPETVVATFEAALHHEQRVSKAIHELYGKALAGADYSSLPLLQWFVNEQVEEESTVSTILDRLKMVGDDRTGLLFLDKELGARVAGGGSTAAPESFETAG
ncbi:MAG: ferritin [Tepidiformaceae bacterium]